MRAPELATGDGALGLWSAVRDVWPETRGQPDWVRRLGNALDKLPKRVQLKAKAALREMTRAESRDACEEEMAKFRGEYEARSPEAVAALITRKETRWTFFEFPAEHWIHIRTSNPIESALSTVRLRQRVTKGAGPRRRGLAMAFKLLAMAQARWRRLNAHELLPPVRAGVPFIDRVRRERDEATTEEAREETCRLIIPIHNS